jgi:hypothetical protein
MGFVMEIIVARTGASDTPQFEAGLACLRGHTAWTSGAWKFSDQEVVPWNSIENTPRQIMALSQHLVTIVRRGLQR